MGLALASRGSLLELAGTGSIRHEEASGNFPQKPPLHPSRCQNLAMQTQYNSVRNPDAHEINGNFSWLQWGWDLKWCLALSKFSVKLRWEFLVAGYYHKPDSLQSHGSEQYTNILLQYQLIIEFWSLVSTVDAERVKVNVIWVYCSVSFGVSAMCPKKFYILI